MIHSIRIAFAYNTLNKVVQSVLLILYFVNYYKLNKALEMVRSLAVNTDQRQNQMFFKIAIMMGITIGISKSLWVINQFLLPFRVVGSAGIAIYVVQQCVIMILYMMSLQTSHCCKGKQPSDTATL